MSIKIIPLPITVPYDELQGSPTEDNELQNFTATRTLRCNWGARLLLSDQLNTGFLVTLGKDCDGQVITSRMGQVYPHRNGVYVDRVECKPMPGTQVGSYVNDTTKAAYEWAVLTVHYRPFPLNVTSGTYLAEESLEISQQLIPMPSRMLFFADGSPLHAEEKPATFYSVSEWQVSYRQLPHIPSCWQDGGVVNNAPVASPLFGKTYAAESLRFLGPRCRRVTGENTATAWDVTLRFSHLSFQDQDTSWNKVLRSAKTGVPPHYEDVFFASGTPSGGTATVGATPFRQYLPVDFATRFFL